MSGPPPRLSLRRAAPLLIVAVVAVSGAFLMRDALSFEGLRDNRAALIAWRDANLPAAALGYMALYVAVVAFSIPGATAMTLSGGFLFGALPAAGMTVLAATLGATCLFLLVRAGLGDALHARILARGGEGALARIERGLRANEVSYLLLMRVLPVVPFFVANLAPAFLGVKLRNFVLTTFVGIVPGTLALALVGAGLGEVFARGGAPDLSTFFEPVVLVPALALAALAALPVVIRALRGGGDDR